MRLCVFLLLIACGHTISAQQLLTAYERSNGTQTFTYEEGIRFCEQVDSMSEYFSLFTYGTTDAGKPLHLLVFDAEKDFNPTTQKEVILINNAIHAGEPDGVEASLMIARDLATDPAYRQRFAGARILIIPFYNIAGALNRGISSRANQSGPEEYGFRASGLYLDLNRDFIKADAPNTFAFYTLFHTWRPSVLIDTHVSNGADYQYTMTLIHTQDEKYGPHMQLLVGEVFIPSLYENMAKAGEEMCPYVNVFGNVPDEGFSAFMETPRYSNGYAALFDCIALVSETHMLKPYAQRVKATRLFLEQTIAVTLEVKPSLSIVKDQHYRALFRDYRHDKRTYPLQWELSSKAGDSILFKGFAHGYKPSAVSGLPRLYYDRDKPFTKKIPYYDNLQVKNSAEHTGVYIIPKAWKPVIERLAANGVRIDTLQKAEERRVYVAHIDSSETLREPYEGHYLHYNTHVTWTSRTLVFEAGDYIIYPDARTENFLMQVLEPEAPDSYFNWNFFDAVLQQKEWFSSYVFEDIAAQLLLDYPHLKKMLEEKKKSDPAFAASAFEQLYFVYRHSHYFETGYMRYPVYKDAMR